MTPDQTDGYTFRMDESANKTGMEEVFPAFAAEVKAYVNESLPLHNPEEYTGFINGLTAIIVSHGKELTVPNPVFAEQMKTLDDEEVNFVVPAWGGVAFTHVDVPRHKRQKYLVVRQSESKVGTLGPEFHKLKDEYGEMIEGHAILISSDPADWERGIVHVTFISPGDKFIAHPGNRHAIIAATNMVIEEKANNSIKSDIYAASPLA